MQKINSEDLKKVSGGVNRGSGSEVTLETILKESQAAVCGMGSVKSLIPEGMNTENTRVVKAYCPECGRKTMFYIGSGAQSVCSVCGKIRLDM